MIIKMDYSKVYELILAELTEKHRYDMVEKLKENPPKKYGSQLFSIDLAEALINAKNTALSSRLDKFELADMDAIKPYGNLRQILNSMDDGKWFSQLKSSGKGKVKAKEQEAEVVKPDFIDFDVTNIDRKNRDDECECDYECPNDATWKDPNTGGQVCDEHIVSMGSPDNEDYLPWDCPNDTYYKYREDIPL